MAGEWRTVRLGDLAEVRSGYAFKSSDMGEFGVPLVKIKNITPPTVDVQDVERIPEEIIRDIPNSERFKLEFGDILIAMTGATVGKVGRFPKTQETFYLNQRVGKVYLRERGVADYDFLYYVLSQPFYVQQMFGWADGSAQANISGSQIESLEVPLPPLPEQRAIAHILGTLDDKIELNRRMSQTLEQMARALFQSWFVDFEPVRAKMEGRWKRGQSLPGMPADTYDLWPARLVPSELGEMPEGWEICQLGELLELAYGRALKEQDRRPGPVPVYGSNGQVGWHDEALSTGPGIIVGRKGNPGTVTWVPTDFYAIDTTFYVVPKEKCKSLHFLFFALLRHDLSTLAADSAVPGLNRNFVYSNLQVVPPPRVLVAFDRAMELLSSKQYQNELESRTLAALRDALLPKLISGEIRVKDAERFLTNLQVK